MAGFLRLFFGRLLYGQAHERSIELLRANLTPLQLQQFQASGYFDVIGSQTGRLYRIHRAEARNIEEQNDKGLWLHKWCFVPIGRLPEGDILLAQKVALECFEAEARAIGVRTSNPESNSLFSDFTRSSRP